MQPHGLENVGDRSGRQTVEPRGGAGIDDRHASSGKQARCQVRAGPIAGWTFAGLTGSMNTPAPTMASAAVVV